MLAYEIKHPEYEEPAFICSNPDVRNRSKNDKYKIPEDQPQCPVYKDNRCCGGCRFAPTCEEGTDFSFTVEEEGNKELTLYMQGDNPEGEDWCETLTIQNPKTKKELIESLYEEVWNCYDAFDVEEETYLMLEAKRNGFQGVPGIVDLVHNEEYKENALKEFADKLRELL